MRNKRTGIFFMLVLLWNAVTAQEATRSKDELKAMLVQVNTQYLRSGALRTMVKYSTEMWQGTSAKAESSTAEFTVNGKNNYAKQENMEVMRTSEYQVFADHNRKVLVVEKRLTPSWEQVPFAALDSLLGNCDKITSIEKESEQVWKLEFSGITIIQLEISINVAQKKINSLVLYFDREDSPVKKVRMDISSAALNTSEADAFFNIEKFVKIDRNGKVSAVAKYRSYRLLTRELR